MSEEHETIRQPTTTQNEKSWRGGCEMAAGGWLVWRVGWTVKQISLPHDWEAVRREVEAVGDARFHIDDSC